MWDALFDHFARGSVSSDNGDVVLRTATGSILLWAMVPTAALVAAIVCWRLSRRGMAPGHPHRDSAVKVRLVAAGLMLFAAVLYGVLLPGVLWRKSALRATG